MHCRKGLHFTIHTKRFRFLPHFTISKNTDTYVTLTWSACLFVRVQAWHEYVNLLRIRIFLIFTRVESMILKFIIFTQANKTCMTLYQCVSPVLMVQWMARRILYYMQGTWRWRCSLLVCYSYWRLSLGIRHLYIDDGKPSSLLICTITFIILGKFWIIV